MSGTPFSGYFLRAWSVLPVEPERVVRAVYLHGVFASSIVWLVGCAQFLVHHANPVGFLLFELPAVFLLAAIILCEAVGDRGRGLLALACLVGFQIVMPVAYIVARDVLGQATPGFRPHGRELTVAAYALGLLGGLPPLVHLRRSARPLVGSGS